MIDRYQITPDFHFQRPLREDDQALVDAIEQVKPGFMGDKNTNFIERRPGDRPVGTFGEVVIGALLNEEGQQDVVYVDVMPVGVIVGTDTREPGTRKGPERVAFFPSTEPRAKTTEEHAFKLKVAERIRLANKAG